MSDGLDLRQELLAAFEAEYREHLQAIRATLDGGSVSGPALRDVFRRAHSLKGAARAVDLPEVERIAHGLETLLHETVEEGQALTADAADAVRRGLDSIELHMRVPEPAGPVAVPGPAAHGNGELASTPEPAPDATLRVPASDIDRLGDAMHDLSDAMQQQEQARQGLADATAEARALVQLWDEARAGGAAGPAAGGEFERRLRQLSRRLSAKLRARRGLDFGLDQAVRSLREQLERIALVTAESVFAPLAGMARELARDNGAEIAVQLAGLELRAERGVLQALRDPAIQLLRNAISHGMPQGTAAGDAPLSIVLSLAMRAGRLEMTVADNGPGPDLARIERIARARGLLPSGPGMAPPDERQLLATVFEPGFSTAASVDRLSGRGMGLSIVAEAAHRLHGTAILRRRAPNGCAVVVSVPLAARRLSLLLVEAGGHLFGLPSVSVEHLLQVQASAIAWPDGRPLLRQRPDPRAGERQPELLLPLASLAGLLGSVDPLAAPDAAARLPVVQLSADGSRCGMVVDRLHDVRTLLVRAPDLVGIDRRLVAGIALVEGGRPVLVLEPAALIGALSSAVPTAAVDGPSDPSRVVTRPQATILVVDDSITTRTLEKTILQAHGYRVLIAVDGMDALNVLRTAQWEIDIVVADVEMPRLDGFGLLAAMRADPQLAGIPTVLMTSRNADADIRRGLELGARAYITKQDFDQAALLSTVGKLVP